MRITYSNLPPKRLQCVATIGVFDGVHRGHKFILDKLMHQARKKGLPSLVITFDSPPKKLLLKKFYGCITDLEEKISIIKSFGIRYVWVLKTNHELLQLSADEFIKQILKRFDIKGLIVGEDFRFGRKGKKGTAHLRDFSRRFKFGLTIIKKKKLHGRIISSTVIRESIRKSNFRRIEEFLGRKYFLKGKVVRGKGIGKKIGFPTVNIHTFDHVIPPKGVYAAVLIYEGKKHLSAFNIGARPTLRTTKKIVIEGHIIDFKKNILGKSIKVVFLERIRSEKKFSSLQKLQEAISNDTRYVNRKHKRLAV